MQELSALRLANTRSDTVSHLALSPETQTVTISTNAYNSWERELEDNITFLYRPFHLPHGEHVTLTVEAELTSVEAFHSVMPAMAGLMIMEGEKPGGKRLLTFLAMGNDLLQYMLSRVEPGLQANNLVYPGAVPEGGPYPIRLRLQLRGRYVIAAYCTAATEEWIPLAPEATWNLPAQGDHVCCGLFVNTGIIGTEARAVFKNLRMYTEELPRETLQALSPEQKREPPLLFREDYRSGALHVDPEDPMAWTDVDQYANLCTLPEGENALRRVWYKNCMPGRHFAGSVWWADYSLSVQVRLDVMPEDALFFVVRHRVTNYYGCFGYAVGLEKEGIALYRSAYERNLKIPEVEARLDWRPLLGQWLDLRIDALDQHIGVFLNGREILRYCDHNPLISGIGNIGIVAQARARAYIGKIEVRELPDPQGGAYDNLIGGNWDRPAPGNFQYSYDYGPRFETVEQVDNIEI